MTKPYPFRVKCLSCNTIAESYHYSERNLPEGAQTGLVPCSCGKIQVDSSGLPKGSRFPGRILFKSDPPAPYEVLD